MVASVLSAFNISKAKDENGVEIDIDPDEFTAGLTRLVIHFPKCNYFYPGSSLKATHDRSNARLSLDLPELQLWSERLLLTRKKIQAWRNR